MSDCICGHAETDHHTSWFVGTGAKLVEECEHINEDALAWDQRCMQYRPAPTDSETKGET